jgi:hypothetical protein
MTQFFTGEINLQLLSSWHHRDIRNLQSLAFPLHRLRLVIQQLFSMLAPPKEMDRSSQAVAA